MKTTRHDLSTSKCRCDSFYLGSMNLYVLQFCRHTMQFFTPHQRSCLTGVLILMPVIQPKTFHTERKPQKYISYLNRGKLCTLSALLPAFLKVSFFPASQLDMGSHLLGALNNPSMLSAHFSFCKTFSSKLPKEEEIKKFEGDGHKDAPC